MNKVIYDEIARKMREQGYNRDTEQCRNKVKNLKKHYRERKRQQRNREGEENMQFFLGA